MKKVFRNLDKPLLVITLLLFVFGLIMVFSASNVTAFARYSASPYYYFLKQAIFLGAGLFAFLLMIKRNTKLYGILSWPILIIIIGMLAVLLVVGKLKNQAASWFDLGFFSIQPSEFAKVFIIIWMARYYEVNEERLDRYGVVLVPLIVSFIVAFLIMLQPDLGTAIIFIGIVFAIFLMEPIHPKIKRQVLGTAFCGIFIAALVLVSSGTKLINARQLQRFDFTNPCDRLLDTGSQVCNGYIAINNGGLTGLGLGNSTQKYLYLAEPYTDFIFTIVVEELGVLVALIILVCYIFVLYRIIRTGKQSYTNRGAVMCYGVAVYMFLHIIVNLLGVLGLIPLTGVPLPFLSYGGSYTLCLIIALSLVQRVSVETGIRNELKKNQK